MTFQDHVLKQAFNHFDKSGDGHISKDELKGALETLGLPSNSFEIKFLIKAIDKDHDGTVSFDEFKKLASMVQAGSGKGEAHGEH
jgi:calcium-binding protein CML